eukprot:m.294840 g.294840  ORF g.294840 m.294840 type:complete len:140 (+) comp16259_c1_seq11:5307-5726(+)
MYNLCNSRNQEVVLLLLRLKQQRLHLLASSSVLDSARLTKSAADVRCDVLLTVVPAPTAEEPRVLSDPEAGTVTPPSRQDCVEATFHCCLHVLDAHLPSALDHLASSVQLCGHCSDGDFWCSASVGTANKLTEHSRLSP